MKYFVMITTKRSDAYTDHALRSFFATTRLDPEDRFILIDNDHSFENYRLTQAKQVELQSNSAPLGFAENVNQVLRLSSAAKADLFILNNDMIFSRDWIVPLLCQEPFIIAPLSNREVRYDTDFFSTQISMDLAQYVGHEAAFDKLVQAHRFKFNGYLGVLVLPFFCVKIPWVIQNRLGCLDPAFGQGGGEDYDYCLRAYLAGYEIKYAMQSYLLHFGAKSFSLGGEDKAAQAERELKFASVFLEKWGERLTHLVFSNDTDPFTSDKDLQALAEQKHFHEIVNRLKPGSGPLVRVN